jgi:methyltransferase-like protein/trans-aconitate methyltransferase
MTSSDFDAVPYVGEAHRLAHISHQFLTATVLGAAPVPTRTARVLELGCARGDNLVAMASTLPEAHFYGIDYSPVQIEQGREMVRALGLTNVELSCQSVTDFDGTGGPFDYIIAHGLLSWIPDDVQTAVLDLIAHHLSPRGIAYISYNTLPGWNARTTVRDLMRFHSAGIEDPIEKVHAARAALDFVVSNATNPALLTVLKDVAEEIRDQEDWYIFHEWLARDNTAFYFVDFVAMCDQFGLDYLGDSAISLMLLSNYGDVIREGLTPIGNQVKTEQYLDFFANRTFRQSLMRRRDVAELPKPDLAQLVQTCSLQSRLTRQDEENGLHRFAFPNGTVALQTNEAPLVALLSVLAGYSQFLLPFEKLVELTVHHQGLPADTARALLTEHALRLFLAGALWITPDQPTFVLQPSERPQGLAFPRYQARNSKFVINANVEKIPLTPPLRALLMLLDGTRTATDLHAMMATRPEADAFPTTEAVEESLRILGRMALLER